MLGIIVGSFATIGLCFGLYVFINSINNPPPKKSCCGSCDSSCDKK